MKVFGNQILQKKKDLVDVNLKGTENKLTFIRCFVILVDLWLVNIFLIQRENLDIWKI